MTSRFHAWIVLLIFAPAVSAQTAKLAAKTAKSWTAPRTPGGHPDLEGYWTNATLIPLERPVELGTKEFYTEAEAAAMDKQRIQRENSQAKTDIHYDNVIWQHENYSKVATTRTSLIFDPPNGRIPPLSAKGQVRASAEKEAARRRETAESAESRNLGERCISWGNEGPPMLGSTYNANLQIVQSLASVAISQEIIHGVRIIPVDGRPHLVPEIRQMGGDSRGHWEGDTLVVDTTNFTDQTNFRPPPATARQDIFSSRDLHVRGTIHAHRSRHDRLPVQGRRSFNLDKAVVGGVAYEEDRGSDLRVRVPRGELRFGKHSGGGARERENRRNIEMTPGGTGAFACRIEEKRDKRNRLPHLQGSVTLVWCL
jgi:hypothetical protein